MNRDGKSALYNHVIAKETPKRQKAFVKFSRNVRQNCTFQAKNTIKKFFVNLHPVLLLLYQFLMKICY